MRVTHGKDQLQSTQVDIDVYQIGPNITCVKGITEQIIYISNQINP